MINVFVAVQNNKIVLTGNFACGSKLAIHQCNILFLNVNGSRQAKFSSSLLNLTNHYEVLETDVSLCIKGHFYLPQAVWDSV